MIGPELRGQLIAAHESGCEWAAYALAKMDSEESREYLVTRFRKQPSSSLAAALASSTSDKLVKSLLVEFHRASPEDVPFFDALCEFFLESQAGVFGEVPSLLGYARERSNKVEKREYAVLYAGAAGERFKPIHRDFEEELLKLGEVEPALQPLTFEAAVWMSIEHTPIELIELARQDADPKLLRDVASYGKGASHVGIEVCGFLDHPSGAVRAAAANTIGTIEFRAGWLPLVSSLGDKDWTVVFCALRSLDKLGCPGARWAIRKVANTHWYPVVRKRARELLANIDSGIRHTEDWYMRRITFFEHYHVGSDWKLENPDSLGLEFEEGAEEYASIYHHAVRVRAFQEKHGFEEAWDFEPMLRLPMGEGSLFGSRRALMYVDEKGEIELIRKDWIKGLFRRGKRVFVLTGVAHLRTGRGASPGVPEICVWMEDE